MPEYRVIWQINLGAETQREAAERAAEILRKLDVHDECRATVFDVYERRADVVRPTGLRIDLSREPTDSASRQHASVLPHPLATSYAP